MIKTIIILLAVIFFGSSWTFHSIAEELSRTVVKKENLFKKNFQESKKQDKNKLKKNKKNKKKKKPRLKYYLGPELQCGC